MPRALPSALVFTTSRSNSFQPLPYIQSRGCSVHELRFRNSNSLALAEGTVMNSMSPIVGDSYFLTARPILGVETVVPCLSKYCRHTADQMLCMLMSPTTVIGATPSWSKMSCSMASMLEAVSTPDTAVELVLMRADTGRRARRGGGDRAG